jgi:isopenicillin N synthase-like dioxygenase
MMQLTANTYHAILCSPCKSKVGFRSLFLRQGDNSPQLKAVFLRLQFFNFLKFEKSYITMVAFFGRLRSVSPCRDTANLINAATNHFAVLRVGLTSFRQGFHMKNDIQPIGKIRLSNSNKQ